MRFARALLLFTATCGLVACAPKKAADDPAAKLGPPITRWTTGG